VLGTKWNSGRILIDMFNAAQKCSTKFYAYLGWGVVYVKWKHEYWKWRIMLLQKMSMHFMTFLYFTLKLESGTHWMYAKL